MEATTTETKELSPTQLAIASAEAERRDRHRLKFSHYDGDPDNFYASVTVSLTLGVTIEAANLSPSEILDAIASERDRKSREYVEALIEESERSDAHIENIKFHLEPNFQFAPMAMGKTYIAWNYLFTADVTTYEHLKSAA